MMKQKESVLLDFAGSLGAVLVTVAVVYYFGQMASVVGKAFLYGLFAAIIIASLPGIASVRFLMRKTDTEPIQESPQSALDTLAIERKSDLSRDTPLLIYQEALEPGEVHAAPPELAQKTEESEIKYTNVEFEQTFGTAMTATGTVTVLAPALGAYPPTKIIQRDHAWEIKVDWEISGPAASTLGGKWKVRCYLEPIGDGFEGQVGPTKEVYVDSAPPLPLPRKYTTTINVPAASSIPGLVDGAYRLVTLINYENMGVPGEIAANQEGPILQFYTAT